MGVRLNILFFLSLFILSQSMCQVNNSSWFKSNLNQINFLNQQTTLNKEYHIVFLLPFCVSHNNFLDTNHMDSLITMNLEDFTLYKKTQISVDFYLGFLSSLNQFKDLNIKISVFDISEGDESKNILTDLLDESYLDNVDLVIGPLFTQNFIFFKDIFDTDIPIISPFSKKTNIIEGNENVFQLPPSLNNQLSVLSKYIFENHINDNLLLVRRDTIFDVRQNNIEGFNQTSTITDTLIPEDIFYAQMMLSHIDTVDISFQEIRVQSNVIDSIHHHLDTLGMRNIIIIPSEDDVFVTDLLSKLHACRDTNMIIYGMPKLSNFNHVSIYDLIDMKVTFPHNKVFNERQTNDFIMDFSSTYHYIPNLKYASVGYELGVYFLNFLLTNQSFAHSYYEYYDEKTILGTTYFFKKEDNGGYRNKAALIFRYDDFGFRRMD